MWVATCIYCWQQIYIQSYNDAMIKTWYKYEYCKHMSKIIGLLQHAFTVPSIFVVITVYSLIYIIFVDGDIV